MKRGEGRPSGGGGTRTTTRIWICMKYVPVYLTPGARGRLTCQEGRGRCTGRAGLEGAQP